MKDQYLLENRNSIAGARFRALAEIFDPVTFRHIDNLGIGNGWRCWEVGAGGSTVIEWLASRVGEKGHVLATDIDVSWAKNSASQTIEIKQHDVAADPPPENSFDLVHARLVLVHVTEREKALQNMIASIRPGGWLLIEDADPALQPLACIDALSQESQLANKLRNGFRTLMTGRGVDLEYGRKLPRLLRQAALQDIGSDGFFPLSGPACNVLECTTVQMIGEKLIDAGLASREELDQHLANVNANTLDLTTAPMISAWGKRP